METVLKELMNRGFLIFEADQKFVLVKIPTPSDSRSAITDEVQSDTSRLEFDRFTAALDKAKSLINCSVSTTADIKWEMQMMYAHKGLGPKIADLGETKADSFDAAKSMAEKSATQHIEEFLEEDQISHWEIRIRPTK